MILRKLKELKNNQSGSAIVLVSLALIALLAITGLVIDGGKLFVTKSSMQKAANAAVLSGAQELTSTDDEVTKIVHDILQSHSEDGSLQNLNIQLEDRVSVDLKRDVSLAFSKIFGFDTAPVEVHAAAELRTMGKAVGVAPLGIDDSVPLDFVTEYKLKVDQSGVDHGFFGILALGGTGAATYEENLRNGYQSPLEIGDELETQTGNIAGKTRSVIQEKLDACPIGDEDERDCERIILIPTYSPMSDDGKQLKEVRVTGFAYFLITAPMDQNDTSITGRFIQRTGTGYEGETALNNGAYSIRLTE